MDIEVCPYADILCPNCRFISQQIEISLIILRIKFVQMVSTIIIMPLLFC